MEHVTHLEAVKTTEMYHLTIRTIDIDFHQRVRARDGKQMSLDKCCQVFGQRVCFLELFFREN
jgi:hypothetical protein